MALPVYDAPPLLESWYADLVRRLSPEGAVVVRDVGGPLGRGLYALTDLPSGTSVVTNEEPLALTPDLSYDPALFCAHCLRPLADVATHVRRMLATKPGEEARFDASVLHPDALAQVGSVTGYV